MKDARRPSHRFGEAVAEFPRAVLLRPPLMPPEEPPAVNWRDRPCLREHGPALQVVRDVDGPLPVPGGLQHDVRAERLAPTTARAARPALAAHGPFLWWFRDPEREPAVHRRDPRGLAQCRSLEDDGPERSAMSHSPGLPDQPGEA